MTATPRARQRTKAVAQKRVHERAETARRPCRDPQGRRPQARLPPASRPPPHLGSNPPDRDRADRPHGGRRQPRPRGGPRRRRPALDRRRGAIDPAAGVRLAVGGGPGGPASVDGPVADVLSSPAVDDGTLYKPVAVDTSIKSSAGMLQQYTVKSGDSLTGIASRFGVSMMTVWWANHLTSKDALHVGQVLLIPPVNGLVVTVKAGDTLDSIATENKIDIADIISLNDLQDPNLIVGQVLVLPGAKGDPMPTPTPTKKPSSGSSSSSSSSSSGGSFVFVSGPWAWPVPGGYISQYFHYGHLGVDIAAPYGSPIVSPRDGHRRVRGLEGQRRRLPGLDLPRERHLHGPPPHVEGARDPPARPSPRARSSAASGRPAGPPDPTTTSRCGSATPGAAAPTGSTRSATTSHTGDPAVGGRTALQPTPIVCDCCRGRRRPPTATRRLASRRHGMDPLRPVRR